MIVDEAVDALRHGKVVALPTDTVYGLAASLAHSSAVAQLFTLKGRPTSVALPVLAHSATTLQALGVPWGREASRLAHSFWPGALTIVVPVPSELAELVGSTTGTVGFRVPADQTLRDVLQRCGPLAVSSANEHGAPPCRNAREVMDTFSRGALAGVVDGGERTAQPSTVVSVGEGTLHVLRQGTIAEGELRAALGEYPST